MLAKEMELSSWSWVYFVSFVLLATFVVLNVVIAVVVNSIDEAHAIEEERRRRDEAAAGHHGPRAALSMHLAVARQAVQALEHELAHLERLEAPPAGDVDRSPTGDREGR